MMAETIDVKNLGVHLDSQLSIKHHVAKVAASCHYHLRHLRQIRRCVGKAQGSHYPSGSGASLDYCNSLLYDTIRYDRRV